MADVCKAVSDWLHINEPANHVGFKKLDDMNA